MITRDTLIVDVLRQYPEAREVFARHGMACIGCLGAAEETVAGGARVHEVDVESLLRELNSGLAKR